MATTNSAAGLREKISANAGLYDEGRWADGKREGWHMSFFPAGQLASEGNWADGKREGLHKWWAIGSHLAETGAYRAGERIGVHCFYDVIGTKMSEHDFGGA